MTKEKIEWGKILKYAFISIGIALLLDLAGYLVAGRSDLFIFLFGVH